MALDILELNRLKRSLLIGSHVWDHRLYSLDSLIKRNLSSSTVKHENELSADVKDLRVHSFHKDQTFDFGLEQNNGEPLKLRQSRESLVEPDDSLEPGAAEAITCYL